MSKKWVRLLTGALTVLLATMAFAGCTPTSETPSQTPVAETASASEAIETSAKDSEIPAEPVTVRFGYQPGHSQVTVAIANGLFDKEFEGENVTFEFEKFASGPPLITALTAGEVDFGQTGDLPALSGIANGLDIKIIGKYIASEKVNALVATAASGITKLEDLKGKKVGFTVGSTGHHLLYIYLESVGLTPEDVEQVNLQPGDIVASLVSGNIDAAITWEPNVSLAVANGAVKVVDGTGYKYEVDIISATSAFATAYPDITARILKVLDEAGKWIEANKEEAIAIVAADAGVDAAILAPIFDAIKVSEIALTDVDIESLRASSTFLRKYELITVDVNVDDYIDTSFAEAAGLYS